MPDPTIYRTEYLLHVGMYVGYVLGIHLFTISLNITTTTVTVDCDQRPSQDLSSYVRKALRNQQKHNVAIVLGIKGSLLQWRIFCLEDEPIDTPRA